MLPVSGDQLPSRLLCFAPFRALTEASGVSHKVMVSGCGVSGIWLPPRFGHWKKKNSKVTFKKNLSLSRSQVLGPSGITKQPCNYFFLQLLSFS